MFLLLSKMHTRCCFLHRFKVSQAGNWWARAKCCLPGTGGLAGGNIFQNGRLSSTSELWARERRSRDNYQHSSSLVVFFSSSGSYFLCTTTVILMGCHLLIKVIWGFSQHTDHKIELCIMFRILSFNKTFYKLSVYLLTNNCPSQGPAAWPVVSSALTARGELWRDLSQVPIHLYYDTQLVDDE